MVIRILFLGFLMVSEVAMSFDHGLYLSVTEIEVSEQVLSITVKVFSDDLYSCMLNRDPSIKSSMERVVDGEVEDYFMEYLLIEDSEGPIRLTLDSLSHEGDSYFIYLKSSRSTNSKNVEVRLGYFYELFPTQRNILKLKTQSDQQHRVFKSKDQKETLSFTS